MAEAGTEGMRLSGKRFDLRLARQRDAEFILRLRLDERLNRYISAVEPDLRKQIAWLARYEERERSGSEYYFVIESKAGDRCGTIRLYDFGADSFRCGSWVILRGSPPQAAFESVLLMYDFGFRRLNFSRARFEVNRGNSRQLAFHKRFGVQIVGGDEQQIYYQLRKTEFLDAMRRYQRIFR